MTTPTSKCELPWCTSSNDPKTHPTTYEPGTSLTHQEFAIARARDRMQQNMLEVYKREGLASTTFAYYQDYYQQNGWEAPDLYQAIPHKTVPIDPSHTDNKSPAHIRGIDPAKHWHA